MLLRIVDLCLIFKHSPQKCKPFRIKTNIALEATIVEIKIYIYIYIYICVCVCMVFTTEGFLEVAIESWPEWDLNP